MYHVHVHASVHVMESNSEVRSLTQLTSRWAAEVSCSLSVYCWSSTWGSLYCRGQGSHQHNYMFVAAYIHARGYYRDRGTLYMFNIVLSRLCILLAKAVGIKLGWGYCIHVHARTNYGRTTFSITSNQMQLRLNLHVPSFCNSAPTTP